MKKIFSITTCLVYLLLLSNTSCGQIENTPRIETPKEIKYETQLIVPDIEIAWGLTFLPNGDILYTEKKGELIVYSKGKKEKIKGLPKTYLRGQGGLMGIALHPKFEENNLLYFTMSTPNKDSNGGNTALYSGVLENNNLKNVKKLYQAIPFTKKGVHFGSRIVFDKSGQIYFSIGDRGQRDVFPQDISKDNGKIYRLNDDGSIPNDNPFFNVESAKKAIYSYGHRNPQGMILHPNGEIWIHEHGPRGGDEINVIESGKNFGWPKITYGKNYTGTKITNETKRKGMEQPIYYWIPSIAPSGMAYLNNSNYVGWNESLLVGSLKFSYLERLEIKNKTIIKREKIADGIGRIRDVIIGPDGYIYISVSYEGIYKIVPKK